MTELRATSSRQPHLDTADPHALCELASLRLEAVQALIKVLLDEQTPGDASCVPKHTLSAANALLTEVNSLYRRAVVKLHTQGTY